MDDIKSDIRRVQAMVQGFIDANHSAPDYSPYKQFAHAVHNLSDIVARLATRLESCPWGEIDPELPVIHNPNPGD